jgi:hypothetical protein
MTRINSFIASAIAGVVLLIVLPQFCLGQTVASPPSPARPSGLGVFGPIYQFATDSRSADFQANVLPSFLAIIDNNLAESVEFTGRSGFKLDASKLYLRTQADLPIRIYFINEGAMYHNSLGFCWTQAGATSSQTPTLLFPDASIVTGKKRTTTEPLRCGDFIQIGVGANGFKLDFFLISDGANGGSTWLWNDNSRNVDRLQHMVAFMIPNSRYILLGFEDIVGGGDLDYNDCLFVVDIGAENAQNLLDQAGTLPN